MPKIKLETKAALILQSLGVKYEREYKLYPMGEMKKYQKPWRFDFAITEKRFLNPDNNPCMSGITTENCKIAIEIQGGAWLGSRGGHTSGKGYTNNTIKLNEAQRQGWIVLQYTAQTLYNIEKDLTELGVI